MKIAFTSLLSLSFLVGTAQVVPVDFEPNGNGANWSWTVFENDANPAVEIVQNPDVYGYNASETVAKFTALQAGMPFAGCETLHGADIGTFTIDNTNSIIRITVWKSVISDVGIKLVRNDGWSLGEIKVPNTKTNEWEQLEFDFSSHAGNTYDQIVVFPDFDARTADNVVYFDDIYGDVAVFTGVAEEKNTARLSVYPNPTAHQINIQGVNRVDAFGIYDMTGAKVDEGTNLSGQSIDVSALPVGMYFIKVTSGGAELTERFTKE